MCKYYVNGLCALHMHVYTLPVYLPLTLIVRVKSEQYTNK